MENYTARDDGMNYVDELFHSGVKGMKWGVRKDRAPGGMLKRARQKAKNRIADRERKALVEDAKNVKYKAPTGTHALVVGKYSQKRAGMIYPAHHLVNDQGKVKMSYIKGADGNRSVAAGRDYMSKVDLNQYFRNTSNLNIEYDIYD